jgi:glycosyltransferase involved in cell wall biosynthesis
VVAICAQTMVRPAWGDGVRVLHVTPSFYPAVVYGGPTYSVYHLCRSLARNGCDVDVLTTNANGREVLDVPTDRAIELEDRLRVHYCSRWGGKSVSPPLLRQLWSAIRRADVVHLMAVYSFPTIPTLLACRLLGKPVVWSPRGMLQRWAGTTRPTLKAWWERVCRLASPASLVLHVTSEEEARESAIRMPGAKFVVIPNGLEVPERVAQINGNKRLRLLFLGRLHPIKGIENLLNAYKLVGQQLSMPVSLTIAGAGDRPYTEELRARIKSLELCEQVHMMGAVTGSEKEKAFLNADVVVVPSHTENFAMVVAEALAYGIPVIASTGTPWQRLAEMGCGLWVDNRPESLAEAIATISRMPLQEMGLKGREWMQKEFAGEVVAKQMASVYESLIKPASPHIAS